MTYALTETIEQLLGQQLQGRSVNAMVFCPFHDNTDTPALSIHQEEGVWQCFGCGERGGLDYLANKLGQSLGNDFYLDRAIRSVREVPPLEINFASLANVLYERGVNEPAGDAAIRHFASTRGFVVDARHHFWLGWDGNRISFPYWDDDNRKRGTVHGIKYRDASGHKTMEEGSRWGVYNVEQVRGAAKVVVCEGESDTILAWSRLAGSEWRVCGTPGAGASRKQWENWALDFLFARDILISYDADEAGDRGSETAISVLGSKAIRLRPAEGLDLTTHYQQYGELPDGLDKGNIQPRLP